jgi:hypothetical protein
MNSYFKILDLLEGDFQTAITTPLTKMEREQLLRFAAGSGRKDVVIYLCTCTDVNIHHQDDTVLSCAAFGEQFEIVAFLYAFDKNWSPQSIEHCLLFASELSSIWFRHFISVLKMPFDTEILQKALIFAAKKDNIGSVDLISTLKDVNLFDEQFAATASNFCSFKIIDFLLERGVDEENFTLTSLNCVKIFRTRKIKSANKIGTWWIPYCYDLNRESGQRMMWNSWRRVEKEMSRF